MLISNQHYFKRISELDDPNLIRDYLIYKDIDTDVLLKLHEAEPLLTIEFYSFLLNKLHKITTNLLRLEPLQVSECIKTATSIITQATITLEKHSKGNTEMSDEFIQCVGLPSLAKSIYVLFSTGKSEMLESELNRVRDDMLFVKNNVPKTVNGIIEINNIIDDKIKNEVNI